MNRSMLPVLNSCIDVDPKSTYLYVFMKTSRDREIKLKIIYAYIYPADTIYT